MKPSTKRCLERLRAGALFGDGWVSGNSLFQVSGTRYGGRIYELRHEHGFTIERRSAKNGSAVDDYRLIEEPGQQSLRLEGIA